MNEEQLRNKYKKLKRRVREIEEENDVLHVRIYKARKSIHRLKLERLFLLERIGKENGEESDAASSHDEALWQKAPVRRRRVEKPKKKKDPNAPKGPGNVFFLYCRFERDKIKDQYPNESLGDITKILAQKWKDLPKDEKQKYYDMYNKELSEYEDAMRSYNASHPENAASPSAHQQVAEHHAPESSDMPAYDASKAEAT